MPPIKLSRIMYVPDTPDVKNKQGSSGDLDLDGSLVPLPDGARHCTVDNDVMEKFLAAIANRNIELEDAVEKALQIYTARLNGLGKPPA